MNQASWAKFVGMLDSNTDPLWRSDMIGAISINPPSLFNFPVVIDNSFLDFVVDNPFVLLLLVPLLGVVYYRRYHRMKRRSRMRSSSSRISGWTQSAMTPTHSSL